MEDCCQARSGSSITLNFKAQEKQPVRNMDKKKKKKKCTVSFLKTMYYSTFYFNASDLALQLYMLTLS